MEVYGYTENGSIDAAIDGTRMIVPDDMENRHRRQIAEEWEALGNTIPAWAEPEPANLATVQAELVVRIDTDAEAARMRFVTPGAGQAMSYWQKSLEATACLADPDPQPETYPLLAAEIGITAPTLIGVAQVVDGERQAWIPIGAAIEALRLAAKIAVRAAETIQAAQAAAVVAWPTPPEA